MIEQIAEPYLTELLPAVILGIAAKATAFKRWTPVMLTPLLFCLSALFFIRFIAEIAPEGFLPALLYCAAGACK